jgi:hypothetical protein
VDSTVYMQAQASDIASGFLVTTASRNLTAIGVSLIVNLNTTTAGAVTSGLVGVVNGTGESNFTVNALLMDG